MVLGIPPPFQETPIYHGDCGTGGEICMWSSIQRTQPLFRREHELEFSENVKKENIPSTG